MYARKRVRERRDDALARVSWGQLEVLLATWYRGQGYEVEHTGTAGSGSRYDGGIDLKLRRPGEYVLVQVKHWNAYQVPHNDVHQLLGLMVNEGATGAILITSGEFTKAAIEAATRHGHVRLIDGDELRAMLGPLPEPVATGVEGQGRGRRSGGDEGFWPFLFRVAIALVVMWFALHAVGRAIDQVSDHLLHPMARATGVPPAPVKSDATPAPQSTQPVSVTRPVPSPLPAPTAADVRASQRQADEAIKVLAPNTPEM